MLDVGMTELLCFAIIAILVLGPEKLPEAARFAGRWYVRLKRYITNLQNEIDQSYVCLSSAKKCKRNLTALKHWNVKYNNSLKKYKTAGFRIFRSN